MNRYIKRYDSENHEMTYLTDIAGVDIIVSKDIIIDEYLKEIERLNNRIEKAIEYIVNTPLYTISYDYNTEDNLELNYVSDEKASNDLLNILNGRSDDNE